MRFTLASSLSTDTVGLTFSSFRRFRKSTSDSCLELTNPLGTDVCLMNSCSCGGIVEAEAGMSATVAGARVTAFFAGTFLFGAIDISSLTDTDASVSPAQLAHGVPTHASHDESPLLALG